MQVTDGTRWLGQHCSLEFVGRTYEQVVGRFGRNRVVVIAQLKETLAWLETAATTGEPPFTRDISAEESGRRWRQKRDEVDLQT